MMCKKLTILILGVLFSLLLRPNILFAQNNENGLRVLVEFSLQGENLQSLEIDQVVEVEGWVYGAVLFGASNDVPDFKLFLYKKSQNLLAFQYTKQFDEWLLGDELPVSLVSADVRSYLLSGRAEDVAAANMQDNEPQLVFPWREGLSWHFTGGMHNPFVIGGEPYSGLDFQPQDSMVACAGQIGCPRDATAADEGVVTYIGYSGGKDCWVVVNHKNGWNTRYLHMTQIYVKDKVLKNPISRGTPLGYIPTRKESETNPACYLTSRHGPHVHIDVMKGGDQYTGQDLEHYRTFEGHYIGGWMATKFNEYNQEQPEYKGYLYRLLDNRDEWVSAKEGRLFKSDYSIFGGRIREVSAEKEPGQVTICSKNSSGVLRCQTAPEGTITRPKNTGFPTLTDVMLWLGFTVDWEKDSGVKASSKESNLYACQDFDIRGDFQEFLFPNSNVYLSQATSAKYVYRGLNGCPDSSRRPVPIDGAPINPSLPPSNGPAPVQNYGCGSQTSGIKFTDARGNCFYMSGADSASLPFSPTYIQVLDPNRKYDMDLCNRNGDCDEFNNSGSIDYSSVSRPFVRAEVKVQGLVSQSDIANCKTSTGKEVKFGNLNVGDKYYTDRNYKIKNISKDELHGLLFLRTPNDDKRNTDPEYIVCDVKPETQIIIAFDGRETRLPEWLKDKYTRMNEEIGVTEEMEHFDLYKCQHKASTKLRLGGPRSNGAEGVSSNYIVIFRKTSGDARNCSSSFNVPPDDPKLNSLSSDVLETPPLLSWVMSDRNHDEVLRASVKIWKDGILQTPEVVLPIGVTQWMPIWSSEGNYTAQIIVKDDSEEMATSNQISYAIKKPVAVAPVPVEPQVSNLQILHVIPPTEPSIQISQTYGYYVEPNVVYHTDRLILAEGQEISVNGYDLDQVFDSYSKVARVKGDIVFPFGGHIYFDASDKNMLKRLEAEVTSGCESSCDQVAALYVDRGDSIVGCEYKGTIGCPNQDIPVVSNVSSFSAVVVNVGGSGVITTTLHFYERPGPWHRFAEATVVLSGTQQLTVTFAVDHFYNDFELVVDPNNEYSESNEEDNKLYKPSLYDFNGFVAGSSFIGNLVVFTQTGQLVFDPSANPNVGQVTYISKDYASSLIFRAPFGYKHIARKDYQTFINQLFANGCLTGCESVVLNFINDDGDIETQTVDHPITMPQMIVYQGTNSECENPAIYAGVDNADVWHKLDEGCGWVREAGYPITIKVPNGHRLDTSDGAFCDGQHVANIVTLWRLQPNEIGCEVYQGWIQTDDEGAEAIAKDFSFNVPEGQVADFWGDTSTLDGKTLKQWTVYRVGPGLYHLTNWTYGTVLVGKDEGANKNHHQWQATYNAIKFGHGIWTSIDLRGSESSDVVLVTDPHQTNQIAGSAELKAFVEFNDFVQVMLEFPISETISMRLASDWITEVRLSRNINQTTDLTDRFTVYVPDDRYAEFAQWQPTIFSDVQGWSHEVMQGANDKDTVGQWIIRNLQVQPGDYLFILLKKNQPANSTVFSSWMWGETIDPQDQPSQPPVVQPTEHQLFLPIVQR